MLRSYLKFSLKNVAWWGNEKKNHVGFDFGGKMRAGWFGNFGEMFVSFSTERKTAPLHFRNRNWSHQVSKNCYVGPTLDGTWVGMPFTL